MRTGGEQRHLPVWAEICARAKKSFLFKFFEFQPVAPRKATNNKSILHNSFHMHLPDMYEYFRFIFLSASDINYLTYHTPALSLKGTSNSEVSRTTAVYKL